MPSDTKTVQFDDFKDFLLSNEIDTFRNYWDCLGRALKELKAVESGNQPDRDLLNTSEELYSWSDYHIMWLRDFINVLNKASQEIECKQDSSPEEFSSQRNERILWLVDFATGLTARLQDVKCLGELWTAQVQRREDSKGFQASAEQGMRFYDDQAAVKALEALTIESNQLKNERVFLQQKYQNIQLIIGNGPADNEQKLKAMQYKCLLHDTSETIESIASILGRNQSFSNGSREPRRGI